MDAGAIAGFLTGLRVYLNDPAKVKQLLLPTKLSGSSDGMKVIKNDESSPSLMNLLMGVKVLQQAIIDLLLEIMVECCQPTEGTSNGDLSDANSKSPDGSGAACPLQPDRENGATESSDCPACEILDTGSDETSSSTSAVQSSDVTGIGIPRKTLPGKPICPPETSAGVRSYGHQEVQYQQLILQTTLPLEYLAKYFRSLIARTKLQLQKRLWSNG